MRGVWRCVRLFRPHPSLTRKLLAVFLPHPGEGCFRLYAALRSPSQQERLRQRGGQRQGGFPLFERTT